MPKMNYVSGGQYRIGSESFYQEERPERSVHVTGFWIDVAPVTNDEFAYFVAETGYVSVAETAPDPRDYPGMPPEMARPGSLLFTPPAEPMIAAAPLDWWSFCFGADWRHPYGPQSGLAGIGDHPVVHVAYADALAYATWAGKALPTEAEWEIAARGGLDRADYAWGAELAPDGAMLANYWQGEFPVENLLLDGFLRTSPVMHYPPNGYGLYDMIGNVWEWTDDWYGVPAPALADLCCIIHNPRGVTEAESIDFQTPETRIGRKVLKGGSHLCAENYCQRYRPAARHPETIDTSTSHIGFRCVVRGEAPPAARQ